jgi:dienelactone hydrolase
MEIKKNILVIGSAEKPMAVDVFLPEAGEARAVIIYAHGFNGFKDWGNFDLIARQFANEGFVFLKFNFSHNGTTPERPEKFVDLEAYARNNYTKELYDLKVLIDWLSNEDNPFAHKLDKEQLYLLGHSLGGGIAILKAAEDSRIKKLATWAAVSECKTPWTSWPKERLDDWQKSGVEYTINSRTKQNLPLYFQLYEDYQHNKKRLDIQSAIKSLKIPVLLCHGANDEAVPLEKARDLQAWKPTAELFIENSDHVFGRKHPWTSENLPEPMQAVVNKTIAFFRS